MDGTGSGGTDGGTFTLTSPELADGDPFKDEHTCEGKGFGNDASPPLSWTGVPQGTMSFGLVFIDRTLIDDNQPQFGNHWVVWDIPASAMGLPADIPDGTMIADPAGAKQMPDSYLGPCPSGNMDTYEFILYALPTATTDVSGINGMGATFVGAIHEAFEQNNLGKAVLSGTSDASP